MEGCYWLFDFGYWNWGMRFSWDEGYEAWWWVVNWKIWCEIGCGDVVVDLEDCERD